MPPVKPFTRWTEDTETAFLLALKLTGRVRAAAEEVGRSVATAYTRRARHPDFAARWEQVVCESQARWAEAAAAEGPTEPPIGRERLDGWTAVRRRAFLRALSETSDVRAACERVRISSTAAYRLRRDQPGFAHAWDAALDRAVPMLEQVAWERAVEGWDEPIVANGQIVGHRKRYSETLLKALMEREAQAEGARGARPAGPHELRLRAHAAARAAGGIFSDAATEAKTDAKLTRLLDGLARRISRDAADAGEAVPDRSAPTG